MSAPVNRPEPQIAKSAPRRSRRYVHAALCVAFASFCAVLAAAAASGSDADSAVALKLDYRRPQSVPYPDDNAHTAERELLGRTLFFDPRLSGSGWISCASCHNPGLSWSDALPRAIGDGMKHLGRRTPTIVNLAWAPALFWDGRADTLEQQALGPIESPGEMNMKLPELVKRLEGLEGYRALFARAYPGEAISPATVGKALATFERGVVSGDAPFDRWVAGDDSRHLRRGPARLRRLQWKSTLQHLPFGVAVQRRRLL